MYDLLRRVKDGLPRLREQFATYVEKQGTKAIESCKEKAVKDAKTYVEELLKVFR